MIVRLVKMHFKHSEVEHFKTIFDASKSKIRNFPGIIHLELLQNQAVEGIFFTYSHWKSEADLERYRNSSLFKETWAKTKPLFAQPAEAWSNQRLEHLP